MENIATDRKIISMTGKRQITIPLKFYEKLRFGKEIECYLADGAIVLRPFSSGDDSFATEILRDLVSQGYNGDELVAKFDEQRTNIKKSINLLSAEADEIALGKRKSSTTDEIFGEG